MKFCVWKSFITQKEKSVMCIKHTSKIYMVIIFKAFQSNSKRKTPLIQTENSLTWDCSTIIEKPVEMLQWKVSPYSVKLIFFIQHCFRVQNLQFRKICHVKRGREVKVLSYFWSFLFPVTHIDSVPNWKLLVVFPLQ